MKPCHELLDDDYAGLVLIEMLNIILFGLILGAIYL